MSISLRRFLRICLATCLHYSGVFALRNFLRRRIFRRREVCVLCLHRVLSEESLRQTNSLSPIILREATFSKLLEYLSRHFRVLSLEDFLPSKSGHIDGAKPCCLLTFDDGWNDNYTTAFPLLKKQRVPAVVFLVTELVESGAAFWVEQLAKEWRDPSQRDRVESQVRGLVQNRSKQLNLLETVECLKHMPSHNRRRILQLIQGPRNETTVRGEIDQMMTWEQAIEMSRAGIEFGAHTVTHPLLTYEDAAAVERELRVGKQMIEEQLGKTVRAFAYPNGNSDERVRRQVKEAGYECAFTTRRGWQSSGDDPYLIRRFIVHEANVTGFNNQFSAAVFNLTLAL